MVSTVLRSKRKGNSKSKKKRVERKHGKNEALTCSSRASVYSIAALDPLEPVKCREKEAAELERFVRGCISGNGGGENCLYVHGMPGTGKTATVKSVLTRSKGTFEWHIVNALTLSKASEVYAAILHCLDPQDKLCSYPASLGRLEECLGRQYDHPQLLVVDEVDALGTSSQSILYNLLEWTRNSTHVSLILLSNTLDMAVQSMPRIASRLGKGRLLFAPYTADQLQELLLYQSEKLSQRRPMQSDGGGGDSRENPRVEISSFLELGAQVVGGQRSMSNGSKNRNKSNVDRDDAAKCSSRARENVEPHLSLALQTPTLSIDAAQLIARRVAVSSGDARAALAMVRGAAVRAQENGRSIIALSDVSTAQLTIALPSFVAALPSNMRSVVQAMHQGNGPVDMLQLRQRTGLTDVSLQNAVQQLSAMGMCEKVQGQLSSFHSVQVVSSIDGGLLSRV
jgi:Cdc6-like AAA superfamily ATPase